MLPKDLTKDIKTRLQSIKGQVDGLVKMLDYGKDPEKILQQFKAVQAGIDKAHFLLLDETYRKALAIKISETVEACPGNCGNEDKIVVLRREFPNIKSEELIGKMMEISVVKQQLDQHNELLR